MGKMPGHESKAVIYKKGALGSRKISINIEYNYISIIMRNLSLSEKNM